MANNDEPDNPVPLEQHDHSTSGQHACDAALVDAIDQYLKHHGLTAPDMVLTDVLLVGAHRGFSSEGTKAGTSVLCLTESSVTTLLGLTQHASIYYGNIAARSMQGGAQ